MDYVAAWARAFLLTCLIEACVLGIALRAIAGWRRRLSAAVFAQAVTHPAVWFIIPALALPQTLYLAVAESWAVGAEALFYRFAFTKLGWARALGLSLLANCASWGLGAGLRGLGVRI